MPRQRSWCGLLASAVALSLTIARAEPRLRLPAFVPPEDGQWLMPAKDYASSRFSRLREITADNVSRLKLAWSFRTGMEHGQEAAPIVAGKTLYIVTPYPNTVFAFDLDRRGAVKWKYTPKTRPSVAGVVCCDLVTRGCMWWQGRIYYNTLDGQTIGLDANTGRELWKRQLGNLDRGETITMAPLIVNGRVIVGNSGGDFGVRGWVQALDANDGHTVWKAFSTGSDADCLIGAEYHPFYPQDRGKDLGLATWSGDEWQIGGGDVWGWISFDPTANLIYYGTGNPGSWNPTQRPGDNKWSCGTFARNPDTGQARWYYQYSPHDLYDHDSVNEHLLLDWPTERGIRPVIVHPERNGYVYVLDRGTGQVISATPFVPVNASKGVDLRTGKLIPNPDKAPALGKVIHDIIPPSPGAKDWQPSAYSPETGLLYIPHQNLAMDDEAVETDYIAGTPYVGVNEKMYAGPGGNLGEMLAWDPVACRKRWAIPEDLPVWSGTLATAGGVVFYGTLEGRFKAVAASTGKLLWSFQTDSGIVGQPTTFRAPDGQQCIAILSGIGGWVGTRLVIPTDTRDQTAGNNSMAGNVMKYLNRKSRLGGTLYVFELP